MEERVKFMDGATCFSMKENDRVVCRFGKHVDLHSLGRDIAWRHKTHDLVMRTSVDFRDYWEELSECPICASDKFDIFGEFFDLRYAECAKCGHLFGLDQINEEGLERLYGSESSASAIYIDEERFNKRIESIALPKVEFALEHIGAETNGKWLDIGSSVGEILAAAERKGWTAVGVETDPTAVAFAKKHSLNVEQAYMTRDNAGHYLKNVKIVSLLNVLEHLKSPQNLLDAIAEGMEDGTWLLVEVPRHPSLTGFAMRAMPENGVRYIFAQHLHLFSEKSLDMILRRAGFQVKAAWFFGQDFYEMLSTLSMTHSKEIPLRFLEKVSEIQKTIDACGLGDVMLVLAILNKKMLT